MQDYTDKEVTDLEEETMAAIFLVIQCLTSAVRALGKDCPIVAAQEIRKAADAFGTLESLELFHDPVSWRPRPMGCFEDDDE